MRDCPFTTKPDSSFPRIKCASPIQESNSQTLPKSQMRRIYPKTTAQDLPKSQMHRNIHPGIKHTEMHKTKDANAPIIEIGAFAIYSGFTANLAILHPLSITLVRPWLSILRFFIRHLFHLFSCTFSACTANLAALHLLTVTLIPLVLPTSQSRICRRFYFCLLYAPYSCTPGILGSALIDFCKSASDGI